MWVYRVARRGLAMWLLAFLLAIKTLVPTVSIYLGDRAGAARTRYREAPGAQGGAGELSQRGWLVGWLVGWLLQYNDDDDDNGDDGVFWRVRSQGDRNRQRVRRQTEERAIRGTPA